MPRARPPYPEEFRNRIVELARNGRTPRELAEEFEPTEQTIRNWSKQGLSAEVLGIVATGRRQAFGADATQTPPDLSTDQTGGYSRVDYRSVRSTRRCGRVLLDRWRLLREAKGLWHNSRPGRRSHCPPPLGRKPAPADSFSCTGPPKGGPRAPKQYDNTIDWGSQEALIRRVDEVGRLPNRMFASHLPPRSLRAGC